MTDVLYLPQDISAVFAAEKEIIDSWGFFAILRINA
jgi:hypothetical protein